MLRIIFVLILVAIGLAYSLRSAFYALLFYLWVAYFRPDYWVWGDVFQVTGLSMGVGAYLVASTLLRGESVLTLGKAGALIVLFCFHSLISTLASDATAYCLPFWLDFAKTAVISCTIIILVTSYEKLRLTLIVMCLSLAFEGAKQGWAQLLWDPNEANMNDIAFLGDNNGVAVAMLMFTPMLFALAQTYSSFWVRQGYRFLGVGTAFRALSTFSRGGLLAFIAMCVTWWIRAPRKLSTLLIVVVMAAALLPVLPDSYWERMGTIVGAGEERDESSAGRIYFWYVAVDMMLDHPVLGVGHNGYSRAFNRYDKSDSQYGSFRAVHSTWFGVLSDLGAVGFLIFISIFISSWWRCARSRRVAIQAGIPHLAGIASAMETALAVFAVGGTFLSFQYNEVLWHFFALSVVLDRITTQAVAVPATETAPVQPWTALQQLPATT